MGLLKNSRAIAALVLVGLFTCIAGWAGCRGTKVLTTTVKDSTSTETRTVYRDTTIIVKGDSATFVTRTDWTAMHNLLASLEHGPRVIKGQGPASLVLTKTDSGELRMDARCEELRLQLDSVIRDSRTTTLHFQQVLEQVAVRDRDDRFRIPGWAKGIALTIGSLIAGIIACAWLLLKFKQRFTNGRTAA